MFNFIFSIFDKPVSIAIDLIHVAAVSDGMGILMTMTVVV